jgi:ElaB/YqjD/DUF883 family membrane-anchored ribosome-binding protein
MNLDTAFRSIYGRDPSPEETNRFNRIGKELGIRDNDAIWAIAFLLGHHLDLAKQMPEQIDKLISQSLAKYDSALDNARRLAEAGLAATKARIEETVSQAVVTSAQREIARAAQTVAQTTARKSWLQWLGGAAVVGMLLIAGAVYWGYNIGNTNGYARSLDVKAVSAWAASSEGQALTSWIRTGI